MAVAHVQDAVNASGSGTSINKAFSSNATAGNAIVAFATTDQNTTHTFSSTGDTWTTIATFFETAAGQSISIGRAVNVTGGAKTVTCTFGGTGNFNGLVISEFSGVATSSPDDVNTPGRHNASSTTPTDASMTTTADGDLVVSVLMLDSLGATVSAGSGFTLSGSDSNGMSAEWQVQSTAGAIAAAFGLSSAAANGILSAALKAAAAAASIPYNPQRSVALRDPGETYWIQKDRRNANLVATAANDLAPPLLVPEHQWQQYRVSDFIDRREVPQQRTYFDPSLLTQVATMPTFVPQRTVPSRDPGESWFIQAPRRDPSLLTTAQLENELLGGAETDKRTNLPATHVDRREVPQQRQYFDLTLLATAQLETPLVWIRPQQFMADRREVPQQRVYISDPSFYPTAAATDPLTVAWGAAGNYWHLYNDVRVERRLVPQQRQLESDPNLLLTAQLESPLNIGSFRWIVVDRRRQPQQLRWPDPSLLDILADPLLLLGDLWRRYNTAATHRDRRQTVPERPRWQLYFSIDVGVGSSPPIVSITPVGTYVSQTGTGSTQQTVDTSFVSQPGTVIVSQTLGGVL